MLMPVVSSQSLQKIAILRSAIFAQILPFRAKSQFFANFALVHNFCGNLRACGVQFFANFAFFPVMSATRALRVQVFLVDPGCFREVDEVVRSESKGRGHVEVMNLKDVNDELERLQ